MDVLPNSVIFQILTFLDRDSFLKASTVCRRWNVVISENIEFFASFFEDENEEDITEKAAASVEEETIYYNPDGTSYTDEQKVLVSQINSYKSNQYMEMLGVAEHVEEDEMRAQYKKLALLLHPDKNKAPGSQKAFQSLKRAFDAVMSGADPEDKDTQQLPCPTVSCGTTLYLNAQKYSAIMKGHDVGYCKVCKNKYGRVFCLHCFSAWTFSLDPQLAGSIVKCTACSRQFALQYPQPASLVVPARPKSTKPPAKKKVKTKNWWEQ